MNLHRLYLTENECYRLGKPLVPRGVMLHSTGANNPNLRRYVGPNDGRLGQASNHWNCFRPGGRQVCVHAFIGRLLDGSVAGYQTLPWSVRGWHCGGKGNDTHIGIELCEDAMTDGEYFRAVYRQAVELTAYLCRIWGLDPLEEGVILSHQEGFHRGIASNHADVGHWFSRFGVTMDDFRREVAHLLSKEEETVTQEQFDRLMSVWLSRRGEEPASAWAKEILVRAKERGLTDATRPQAFATREEVAAMVAAAVK